MCVQVKFNEFLPRIAVEVSVELVANKDAPQLLERNSRKEFVEFHLRSVHLFAVADGDVASVDPPCRDSSDNMFLALSMVAQADVLISGDKDLLILNPWRGVPIVQAAEFLAQAK